MAETYYKPCSEFDRCNELIEKYWNTKQFEKCFEGHMELAEKGYPLAECQVGYFFYDGIGVEKDADKAFYWTQRAVEAIAKRYEELVVDAQDQTVGIAHADCAPDAQILASLLRRSSKPPKKILTVDYEPVTGSHVGPGALALFFLSDENVRNI